MTGRPLNEVLEAVARAAGHGVEQTKNTVATKGKSKALGQRAIGHSGLGALSTYLIIEPTHKLKIDRKKITKL